MAKFLTLMNPHRRRRSRSRRRLFGAALRAHQKKTGVFKRRSRRSRRRHSVVRYRRNPVRRRNRPPRMTPAMRAKISRAVKASFRRRRSSPVRRTMAVARRSFRRSSVARRGFGGGNLMSSLKSAISKPMLMKAGGAVIASVGTGMIINRWGASLPGINNKWGRVAYSVGIPIGMAYIVKRYARQSDVAEGMVIGALVMGINAIIQQARAASAPSLSDYQIEDMSVAGELGFYPSHPGSVGSNLAGAFPQSAW